MDKRLQPYLEELSYEEPERTIIPDHCLSYTEASLYVAEFIEEAYLEMMEDIGSDEVTIYEQTGSQVVYEDSKLQEFKDKLKDFSAKSWTGVQGFWEKFVSNSSQNAKEAADELGNGNVDISKLPNKTYGKVHEFPDFEPEYNSNAKKFIAKASHMTSLALR